MTSAPSLANSPRRRRDAASALAPSSILQRRGEQRRRWAILGRGALLATVALLVGSPLVAQKQATDRFLGR